MIDLATPPLSPDDDPSGFILAVNGIVVASEPWELFGPQNTASYHEPYNYWKYEGRLNRESEA